MNKTLALALAVVSLALPAAAHGRDRSDGCDDEQTAGSSRYRDTDIRFARDMANGRDSPGYPAATVVDVETAIRDGVWSGRLTRREADMLRAQARDVEVIIRRSRRTGRLSHGEAHQIARAEDRLADTLQRELEDGDRRFGDRADGQWPSRHDDRSAFDGREGREHHDSDERDGREDRDRHDSDERDGRHDDNRGHGSRSGTVAMR